MKRNVKVITDNAIINIPNAEVFLPFNHYVNLEEIPKIEAMFNINFEDYYAWRQELGFDFVKSLYKDTDNKVDLHDFVSEFPKTLIKSPESDKAIEDGDWDKIFSLPRINEDKPDHNEVKKMINILYDKFDSLFIPIKDINELNSIKNSNVLLIDYKREFNRCFFTLGAHIVDTQLKEFIYSDKHKQYFSIEQ